MKYLLDTNVCVELIRRRSPQTLARLMSQPVVDVGVSTITVAELRYGAERSARPAQNQQALDQFLLPLDTLPFDEAAADAYGHIRADLESQGLPIGSLDTLIAAQASAHRLILVTNNVREFARVPGLMVEDWTQP
ncbi:MAG: type II toxin-antitoxin system VapC family toxin [Planctomycetales bacterium]